MEFWETGVKKMSALRYLMEPAPVDATLLTLEIYVHNNTLLRRMFKLVIRKKLEAFFRTSLDNLAVFVEGSRIAA
jgi:hypothetical protein